MRKEGDFLLWELLFYSNILFYSTHLFYPNLLLVLIIFPFHLPCIHSSYFNFLLQNFIYYTLTVHAFFKSIFI